MNGGLLMSAWYDIKGNPQKIMSLKENKKGLLNSVDQIEKIIQEETNLGIQSQKIMLVGHSQGASLALTVGLTSEYHLAGIIGLSAFLPCRNEIFNWAKAENKINSFFLYHNRYDNVIPSNIGSKSAQILKEKGYRVEFEDKHNGNHFFRLDELQEILIERINQLIS
ncbi:MAG: Carboxylesterase 2 [Mycoplasmataceae bacterium]|nr:MAG: Carboxylesterase 2 [Mycoplasmataceae bacterium]